MEKLQENNNKNIKKEFQWNTKTQLYGLWPKGGTKLEGSVGKWIWIHIIQSMLFHVY
jgi:hypothetical protein